jgi:hypothetical protein
MLVFGYFCVGANTRWGREHAELSYGSPSAYHIPFTDEYLEFLGASIEDAVKRTGMDGFMIDWVWCPTDEVRKQRSAGKWLASEKRLFEELLAKPFPGEDRVSSEDRLAYERKAINRCWARIREAARRANPAWLIWLSCNDVLNAAIKDSPLLREVDWVMDESGTPAAMKSVAHMFGSQTRQLLCLAGWGERHKTQELLSDPAMAAYGIYGFSAPAESRTLPMPIFTYLDRAFESFQGNDRSIAILVRFFNGQPPFKSDTPRNGDPNRGEQLEGDRRSPGPGHFEWNGPIPAKLEVRLLPGRREFVFSMYGTPAELESLKATCGSHARANLGQRL